MSRGGVDPALVHAAIADTGAVLARAHRDQGGACLDLPGVRLMSSGLQHPQWNSADVHTPARVDVDAVRAWYAARGVPWGLRIAVGTAWTAGRWLLTRRTMVLLPPAWSPPRHGVPGLRVRSATDRDLDVVLAIDTAAFHGDADESRPWLEPHLATTAHGIEVVVAELDGEPVGTAYAVRADGRAGFAVHLAGVGVLEHARRRGVATAMAASLVGAALDAGATLAHLNPDTDEAARVYGRLGFVEVRGLDVYVDI